MEEKMERTPKPVQIIVLFVILFAIYWVIHPEEPAPFTNKPVQTVEVRFYQERADRISLGRDSEMRLAILAEGPARAISVICPRDFNPDPTKKYIVDGFGMRDETGRSITHPVWILRNKTEDFVPMTGQLPNVGEFTLKSN